MGISKFVYNDQIKFDITDTTAIPETVLNGYIFYGANGERLNGIASSNSVGIWYCHGGILYGKDTCQCNSRYASRTAVHGGYPMRHFPSLRLFFNAQFFRQESGTNIFRCHDHRGSQMGTDLTGLCHGLSIGQANGCTGTESITGTGGILHIHLSGRTEAADLYY